MTLDGSACVAVLGKQVIPVFRDGASDAPTFAAQASALLANPNITSVFGSAQLPHPQHLILLITAL